MVPPGGSATLYGVLYQLLGSLHHTVRLRVQKRGEKTVLGARLTVEPPKGGGDLWIESPEGRFAEQWKARTSGLPWGLQEILDKVIPDLYLDPALDLPDDRTKYVFATEGRVGPKARAFFQRLSGPMPEKDPLAGLGREDRKLFRDTARGVQKRMRARSEEIDLTYRKLRRLLNRFEIRDNQGADRLVWEIDRWLLALIDHIEDIPATRDQLCTILLRRGTGKNIENEFMPEDLLREAGLVEVSLKDEEELRRKAREVLDREVARRKYDRAKDVRDAPDLPQGKGILFLSGESGQGKTWQTARLALDRAEGGRLTVVVDSAGEAERDLQKASDRLWKEAWGRNRPISLDQLVERWREVRGDDGRLWLTVCVENVESQKEARALLRDYDWERWGVELVLTGSPQIGGALAEENPERVHHVRLRDFTPAELRDYLRRHGRSWETVPADVRDTLKRPLLAGLYTSLGPDPDFAPVHEYRLYEKSWQKIGPDLIEHPEDLDLLKGLILTLLDEEPHYPWTWEQLRNAGVSSETRARLERVGWWTRNEEGVEVWHDRMLSWALSQALAEQGTVANLTSQLNRRSTNPRIQRILGYLLMDVLWILSGNPARSHLVPDLLVSLEEYERPFGYRRLYQAGLLPTLGLRIIPGLMERLRRLPDRVRYSYTSLSVEALSKILDKEPEGRADLPAGLSDPSSSVRKVTVKVLARHPGAAAIGLLWNLLREKSLQIEETKGKEGLSDRQSAFAALRACLELNPEWLRSKIQESKPETEPVWELAYLLANIKHPAASSIWMDVKENLLEKVGPGKLHSLMVCIRVFRDAEEIPRLEEWLPLDEKWTSNTAFEGIARIDPDRAVFLLETMPLSALLASNRSWLPILLLSRPDDTQRALRKRMGEAGEDFWEVADLYWRYEERIDRETVEALLNRLAVEVAEALQGTEEARNRLHRPLRLLSRIHRVDLLECFQARSGTDLDRRLGELGAASIDSSQLDLEELRTVLLKIGGDGFRRLIRAGLASSEPDHRADAMFWGLVCPEEITAIATGKDWMIAAVGEDRDLVAAVMGWDTAVENDFLKELWRLRRWKPPMSDTDLAPALEGLRSANPQQRVRGMEVVSISGREDLLSHLPEWLEGTGNLAQRDIAALDARTSHLVHRLAGGNPESVREVARSLDVRRFPWTAVQLLYEVESPELADRLEADLLARLTTNGRLQESERDLALHLDHQARRLPDPLLRAVWGSGKSSLRMSTQEYFYPAVSRIDSEEVRERIWKEAFEAQHTSPRINAIRALHSLDSEEALRAARRGLENPETKEREGFVSLLFEIGGPEAVPWLVEQAMREKKTEVLWEIARVLRRAGPAVQSELRTRLESPDFRVQRAAAHLAGWQGIGFLEADLQRMAEEDPDDDVQWECLQALARQRRERCVVELMDAFRRAQGITRWSYLESILELGDPRLLVTQEDPLWLGHILTPELGQLEVHANFRLKERFKEVKSAAEQRDRRHEN